MKIRQPFSALAFKVANDPFVGSLNIYKNLFWNNKNWNSEFTIHQKKKKKELEECLLMHANSREDIKEANAGDIVALAGLKHTITGHTLCDEEKPVLLRTNGIPRTCY